MTQLQVGEVESLQSAVAGQGNGEESDLVIAGMALRKHWLLASSLTLCVFICTLVFGFSRTRIYEASAVIQIDPRPSTPLGRGVENVVQVGSENYWDGIEYAKTQHALIESKPVCMKAAEALSLHLDPGFLGNVATAQPVANSKPVKVASAASVVCGRLAVVPEKETRLVSVRFEDADPKRAERVLGAVLEAYFELEAQRKKSSTSSAVDWLDEQVGHLRKELVSSEQALHDYKKKKEISTIGLDDQANILLQEMAQLSEVKTRAEISIQEASSRMRQLQGIKNDDPESLPKIEVMRSPALDSIRSEYLVGRRELRALQDSGKGENHPEVRKLSGGLSSLRESFAKEVDGIRVGVASELEALRAEHQGVSSLLVAAEKKALELNLMDIEYRRLQRTMEHNEKLYGLVLERSKEAGLVRMLKTDNIRIISAPEAGNTPVKPRMVLLAGFGVLAGVAIGIAGALVMDRSDRTLRNPADMAQRGGLTPLGVLPNVESEQQPTKRRRRAKPEKEAGVAFLMVKDSTNAFSESVRALRTNLLLMSPDRPIRRLLVTSASPSEGKTTVSCSIAMAMAQAGQNVLVIDADMRKPRLGKLLAGNEARATLTELLVDSSVFDTELAKTQIPNLSVLPSGVVPPNPAELLHSVSFRELLNELSEMYDFVLIDSPPLVVTDAAIVSNLVDGTLLVARMGKTEFAAARKAVSLIESVGGRVIGGVLNGMKREGRGYGYGYGYGYGGERYGEEQSAGTTS